MPSSCLVKDQFFLLSGSVLTDGRCQDLVLFVRVVTCDMLGDETGLEFLDLVEHEYKSFKISIADSEDQ